MGMELQISILIQIMMELQILILIQIMTGNQILILIQTTQEYGSQAVKVEIKMEYGNQIPIWI